MSPSRATRWMPAFLPPAILLIVLAVLPGCHRSSGRSVGTATVRINEVMAANVNFRVTDEAGNVVYNDWVEIHNPGRGAVNLFGYSLSDNFQRPRKYEFPRGTVIAPGGFLLVFIFGEERCQLRSERDRRGCVEECDSSDATCREECENDHLDRLENCAPPIGYVADFNASADAETLFLFADGGRFLVDQAGVKGQVADRSNGIDPETGEYGVIYVPTPRARNAPLNLKMHQFVAPPASTHRDCDKEIEVKFSIDRDLAAPGDLAVTCQWADVDRCGDSLDGEDLTPAVVVRVTPAGGDEIWPDTTRVDLEGKPVTAEVIRLTYVAILPPASCATNRAYRVTARDAVGTEQREGCVPVGAKHKTILVNEYQPKNANPGGIELEFVDKDDGSLHVRTPDWIEIINHGDEEQDIRDLALISLGDLGAGQFDTWVFGKHGRVTVPLPPRSFLWVLADDDERPLESRRVYHLKDMDSKWGNRTQDFYSTHFRLNPNQTGKPGDEFDGFALVDSATGDVLDKVVLDFSKNPELPFDIKENQSAGRFKDEGFIPNALMPGTITDFPTPGKPNTDKGDTPPTFKTVVTIESEGSVRCPAADEPVTVRAQFNADKDTESNSIKVSMGLVVDPSPPGGVEPEVTVTKAENQSGAAPGTTLYDIAAVIPGLPASTFVELDFKVRDERLGAEAHHRQEDAPEVSFQYLVGFVRPDDSPRLNEAVPGGTVGTVYPPPFDGVAHDFAEIFNPSSEPLDLSGFYLTTGDNGNPRPAVKDPDPPIERARQFKFPEGTVVAPGGFLPMFFGPPPPPPREIPGYVEVTGFNLRCELEVLYLIAPDGKDRGANCVVDSIRWNLVTSDDQGLTCKFHKAVGRICDGCGDPGDPQPSCVVELALPTPGTTNSVGNVKPLELYDVYHEVPTLLDSRNECPEPNAAVLLNAVFYIDHSLTGAFTQARRLASASFFVDRGMGSGEEEIQVRSLGGGARTCPDAGQPVDCAPKRTAEGYDLGSVNVIVNPPLGPIVRYRVHIVDACGTASEAGPFSFGTAAAQHPRVVLNEINRFSTVPGDPAQRERPWIELVNLSSAPENVSGMFLSDNIANPRKARLPDDAPAVGPGGFLVVLTDGQDVPGLPRVDLSWQRDIGTLFIFDAASRGSCVLDALDFDLRDLLPSESLGRVPDGTGPFVGPPQLPAPTPGSRNGQGDRPFIRGDSNGDSKVNVTDMVRILTVLFSGEGGTPACEDAFDADDNGKVNATDPIYIGNYVFRRGPVIPPPFPLAGSDPTPDELGPCGP